MSTPAHIAVEYVNGQVDVIYCHNDGMPSRAGKILLEHYNKRARGDLMRMDLMQLGDLSRLAPQTYPTFKEHTFDTPQKGVCVAYGRDRGDADAGPLVYATVYDYISDLTEGDICQGIEWVYLWRHDVGWTYAQLDGCSPLFKPLTRADVEATEADEAVLDPGKREPQLGDIVCIVPFGTFKHPHNGCKGTVCHVNATCCDVRVEKENGTISSYAIPPCFLEVKERHEYWVKDWKLWRLDLYKGGELLASVTGPEARAVVDAYLNSVKSDGAGA